jgi:hypothetical protein
MLKALLLVATAAIVQGSSVVGVVVEPSNNLLEMSSGFLPANYGCRGCAPLLDLLVFCEGSQFTSWFHLSRDSFQVRRSLTTRR